MSTILDMLVHVVVLFATDFSPIIPIRITIMVPSTLTCVALNTCSVTACRTIVEYLYWRLVKMAFLLCVFFVIFSRGGSLSVIVWKLV